MDRRKTCGDCIHADICKEVIGGWFSPKNIAYCKAFKDRTKYVEVVRCKDCNKSKRSHLFGSGWRFCMNNSQHHKDEHFCSYGERREGE